MVAHAQSKVDEDLVGGVQADEIARPRVLIVEDDLKRLKEMWR
jgi:hypothetical protein